MLAQNKLPISLQGKAVFDAYFIDDSLDDCWTFLNLSNPEINKCKVDLNYCRDSFLRHAPQQLTSLVLLGSRLSEGRLLKNGCLSASARFILRDGSYSSI